MSFFSFSIICGLFTLGFVGAMDIRAKQKAIVQRMLGLNAEPSSQLQVIGVVRWRYTSPARVFVAGGLESSRVRQVLPGGLPYVCVHVCLCV